MVGSADLRCCYAYQMGVYTSVVLRCSLRAQGTGGGIRKTLFLNRTLQPWTVERRRTAESLAVLIPRNGRRRNNIMIFKYVYCNSPIDYFHGTMSKDELIENADFSFVNGEDVRRLEFAKEVEEMCGYIRGWIDKDAGELPHTIQFFSIPNFDNAEMDICAMAKISNNGTTYMFTNNEKFYTLYAAK